MKKMTSQLVIVLLSFAIGACGEKDKGPSEEELNIQKQNISADELIKEVEGITDSLTEYGLSFSVDKFENINIYGEVTSTDYQVQSNYDNLLSPGVLKLSSYANEEAPLPMNLLKQLYDIYPKTVKFADEYDGDNDQVYITASIAEIGAKNYIDNQNAMSQDYLEGSYISLEDKGLKPIFDKDLRTDYSNNRFKADSEKSAEYAWDLQTLLNAKTLDPDLIQAEIQSVINNCSKLYSLEKYIAEYQLNIETSKLAQDCTIPKSDWTALQNLLSDTDDNNSDQLLQLMGKHNVEYYQKVIRRRRQALASSGLSVYRDKETEEFTVNTEELEKKLRQNGHSKKKMKKYIAEISDAYESLKLIPDYSAELKSNPELQSEIKVYSSLIDHEDLN